MAETTKLSVEKAPEKLRGSDPPKSKNARFDEKIDALEEEIKRMRAQRLCLEQHQRKKAAIAPAPQKDLLAHPLSFNQPPEATNNNEVAWPFIPLPQGWYAS
jgi:hypothetical protein